MALFENLTANIVDFGGTAVAVASLPTAAASNAYQIRACSNGRAGNPCLVMSTGSAWVVIGTGTTAAAQ